MNAYFEASPMGMGMVDPQLRYLKVNQPLADFIGLPVEDYRGKTIREIVPQLAYLLEPLYQQVFATGKPILNFEISGETDSSPGEVRDWLISLLPSHGGGCSAQSGWHGGDRNHGAKRAEVALNYAKMIAEKQVRRRTNFLANMSHEIRTPMNGVIGMTGLLLDTELSAKQLDCAETIRSERRSLLTIINDVLDLSKIEAGELEVAVLDFDLYKTVECSIDVVAQLCARERG